MMVAALMACFAVLIALEPVRAEETSRVNIPKGAKVEIQSSTARMTNNGVTGTYSCKCSGQGGCFLSQNGSMLTCGKVSDNSCTGSCAFVTTTNGATPGRAQIPAGAMKSDR